MGRTSSGDGGAGSAPTCVMEAGRIGIHRLLSVWCGTPDHTGDCYWVAVDNGASPAGPRCPRYVRHPCQVFHLLSCTAGARLLTFILGMHTWLVTSRAAIAGGWLAGWTGVRGAGVLQPYISGVVSSFCRLVLIPCGSKFS